MPRVYSRSLTEKRRRDAVDKYNGYTVLAYACKDPERRAELFNMAEEVRKSADFRVAEDVTSTARGKAAQRTRNARDLDRQVQAYEAERAAKALLTLGDEVAELTEEEEATQPDEGSSPTDDDQAAWVLSHCSFCGKELTEDLEALDADPIPLFFCDSDCLHAFNLCCESFLKDE